LINRSNSIISDKSVSFIFYPIIVCSCGDRTIQGILFLRSPSSIE
jgi:hypothetical protein